MKSEETKIRSLVENCKKGKPKAQKQLFAHFAPKVMGMCRRYVQNNEIAKDVFQECFIQIFGSINNYSDEYGVFDAWLCRVSQRTIWRLAKKERNISSKIVHEINEDKFEVESDALERLTNEEIIEEIQYLPEGYRLVLNLYVFESRSHKEIAAMLGITPSSSRSQLTRARQLLKKNLEAKNIINYAKNTI